MDPLSPEFAERVRAETLARFPAGVVRSSSFVVVTKDHPDPLLSDAARLRGPHLIANVAVYLTYERLAVDALIGGGNELGVLDDSLWARLNLSAEVEEVEALVPVFADHMVDLFSRLISVESQGTLSFEDGQLRNVRDEDL